MKWDGVELSIREQKWDRREMGVSEGPEDRLQETTLQKLALENHLHLLTCFIIYLFFHPRTTKSVYESLLQPEKPRMLPYSFASFWNYHVPLLCGVSSSRISSWVLEFAKVPSLSHGQEDSALTLTIK